MYIFASSEWRAHDEGGGASERRAGQQPADYLIRSDLRVITQHILVRSRFGSTTTYILLVLVVSYSADHFAMHVIHYANLCSHSSVC